MNFSDEQIATAKTKSIVQILSLNGFEPVRQDNRGFWYKSPLRNEKSASFCVYRDNTFYDFGTSTGKNCVDLVMLLKNISFKEAINVLLENEIDNFSFDSQQHAPAPSATTERKIIIESIKPLKNPFFLEYIRTRKISIEIAERYLSEIYYKVTEAQEKCYFGIGMQNQAGMYEIKNVPQNKYYCLGKKDITLIDNRYIYDFMVFEGMFDFLASLTYYQKPFKANIIILHSVSNVQKFLDYLQNVARNLYLCLDNDSAGDTATKKIISEHNGVVKDCRHIYKGYKDFNEFLIKTK